MTMTKEDKQLLLQDLCARLPYNVKVKVECGDIPYGPTVLSKLDIKRKVALFDFEVRIENCKPYLRPMSSMTEEEKENLQSFHDIISDENYSDGYSPSAWYAITAWEDYCNSKHLDYRGLIKKELAIAVTEENNPYKEKL